MVAGRRQVVSSAYCETGLVSWEFLQHLESIADTNRDGDMDEFEFNASTDPSLVTVDPGCSLKPGLREQFPNVAWTDPRSCHSARKRHSHASSVHSK